MYLGTFGVCFLMVLFMFLTENQYTLADISQENSSKNGTNSTGSTTDQPSALPPTTRQQNSETEKPNAKSTTKDGDVVSINSDQKESKPKKSHTGRITAAIILGVGFMFVVCGAIFYKAYKSNSEESNASGGYSHPTHRLSNCLELQCATASERRPIMQTTIETEGIEGLDGDGTVYDV